MKKYDMLDNEDLLRRWYESDNANRENRDMRAAILARMSPQQPEAPKEAELLPCPFCGGKGKLYRITDGWFVGCYYRIVENAANDKHKYCELGSTTDLHETPEEAITAWNTRVPRKSAAERKLEIAIRVLEELKNHPPIYGVYGVGFIYQIPNKALAEIAAVDKE